MNKLRLIDQPSAIQYQVSRSLFRTSPLLCDRPGTLCPKTDIKKDAQAWWQDKRKHGQRGAATAHPHSNSQRKSCARLWNYLSFIAVVSLLLIQIILPQQFITNFVVDPTNDSPPIPLLATRKEVTCDSDPCDGFFAYAPPNKNKTSAAEIFKKEVAVYGYGGDGVNNETSNIMIFIPNETSATSVEGCVEEWKEGREKWTDRGMSANQEDMTIFQAFFNKPEFFNNPSRTYLEIGAHDGVRESNSRFYDVCLGWSGLLVEPHPDNYAKNTKLRPNAHHLGVAPSCLGNSTGIVSFSQHTYTSAMVEGEVGSLLEIHCGPLSYYLDALDIRHIDFWSLDVEGSELALLKTVDFERVHIDVIIVEVENRLTDDPKMKQQVEDVRVLLREKGYVNIQSVVVYKSDVWLHQSACSNHGYEFTECEEHRTVLP